MTYLAELIHWSRVVLVLSGAAFLLRVCLWHERERRRERERERRAVRALARKYGASA